MRRSIRSPGRDGQIAPGFRFPLLDRRSPERRPRHPPLTGRGRDLCRVTVSEHTDPRNDAQQFSKSISHPAPAGQVARGAARARLDAETVAGSERTAATGRAGRAGAPSRMGSRRQAFRPGDRCRAGSAGAECGDGSDHQRARRHPDRARHGSPRARRARDDRARRDDPDRWRAFLHPRFQHRHEHPGGALALRLASGSG